MTAGQAAELGFAIDTPTRAHSGRENSHIAAGATIATAAGDAHPEPRPARGTVPQLRDEVRQGEDDERQRRVVVVLEGGPVDARPRHPLGGEADRDQRQGRRPAPEGHHGHEHEADDPEPPDDQVPRVVDRGTGPAGEALLVEPHRFQVEREGPPRRRRGVRRGEAIVVVVHAAGQLEQRLPAVGGREAVPEPMVLDRGPRQVGHDVDPERDRDEADGRPDDRYAEQPAGPQPAGRRRIGRVEETLRIVGTRRGRERTVAEHPADTERGVDHHGPEGGGDGGKERGDRDGADDHGLIERAHRQRTEEQHRADGARSDQGQPHLLVGPGDGMEDRDDDGEQCEADHDHEEWQVAVARTGHRQVAERPGHGDEAQDGDDAAEGAAHEEQQHERPDRVRGHPLRGERQPEEQPDDRHPHPERGTAPPPARPDRGEDGVGRDDEQADVGIVHADARLDEQHALQRERGRRRRARPCAAGTGSSPGGRGRRPSGRRRSRQAGARRTHASRRRWTRPSRRHRTPAAAAGRRSCIRGSASIAKATGWNPTGSTASA